MPELLNFINILLVLISLFFFGHAALFTFFVFSPFLLHFDYV